MASWLTNDLSHAALMWLPHCCFFGTVIKLLSKDYNNFYLSGTEMRLAANLGFRSSLRIELFCRKSHQMYFMYS